MITELTKAVAAVCPIDGVSIGRVNDRATWRIDYKLEASAAQRRAAAAVLEAFDPLAPTVADVKAEAGRRITARFSAWQQQNMTARGVELQDIWRRNGAWTVAEQSDADSLTAAWAWITLIRTKSNEIEAMSPMPHDYTSDQYWT